MTHPIDIFYRHPDFPCRDPNRLCEHLPYTEEFLRVGRRHLTNGKFTLAVGFFQLATENEFCPCSRTFLGKAFYLLKKFPESLEAYNASLEIRNDCPQTYRGRGHTLVRLKKYSAALHSFDKAIELDKGYVEACQEREQVLQKLEQIRTTSQAFIKSRIASSIHNSKNKNLTDNHKKRTRNE